MAESLVLCADNLEVLREVADDSFEAVVTDPPYGLSKEPDIAEVLRHWLAGDDYTHRGSGFMGKSWDSFVPGPALWREVLRVLKPGGHALVFAGTRTVDLMGISLRMAGFELRDTLQWVYASGFPKSYNGPWGGTALKPAHEPILFLRKPLIGTLAENVRRYGTGGLNIDGCRVGSASDAEQSPLGRWPANFLHDGSDEVVSLFPEAPGQLSATRADGEPMHNAIYGAMRHGTVSKAPREEVDKSAARFFYCAKASRSEREAGCGALPARQQDESRDPDAPGANNPRNRGGKLRANHHPCVKPIFLMQWLVRLVTPEGGTVLDPFAGSGSTGIAAALEGAGFVGIEQDPEYAAIAEARIAHHSGKESA